MNLGCRKVFGEIPKLKADRVEGPAANDRMDERLVKRPKLELILEEGLGFEKNSH